MHLLQLISQAQQLINQPDPTFPVQVFHCKEAQHLHQVHFYQPTLMLVLKGAKQISGPINQQCPEGNLILVSQGYEFPFANLPDDFYMALFIGFQPDDFPQTHTAIHQPGLDIKQAPDSVLTLIHQLMTLKQAKLPDSILSSRRQELAQLLTHLELDSQLRSPVTPSWRSRLATLIQTDIAKEWRIDEACKTLATSESNLRRRLQQENTGFREVLEDLRLTNGLGMLQTTQLPINQIAIECGYQSASRFSERFKKRFHTTPSELRQAL